LAYGRNNSGFWRSALGRYSQEETSMKEIQMNSSSNASTERRNPMPKPFTTIVPPSFKAASETYQYAPAVRIGDQILISGIIGADAEGRLPPDFRGQAENVFTTLEAILKEAGATLDDVASLHSYHVGDLHSQLRELVDIKAKRIRPPHPAWTGVGVTQLGVPGALLEISAVAVARDQDVDT
jgi:enamine deaminase RidA (YjgF/YER057c/UK114 family)